MLPSISKFINSLKASLSLNAQACISFVDIANKIKIPCKKIANKKKKIISKKQAKKTVELLQNAKFPL